ncbi:MAG TPA: aminomethyl-transferring glycine dehydrogenase subunit GcvPB [Chloroflexota bacterium]|nr:aminomethyl-transferring glycine dehydrogenase subunit GcvPB [Chloroflexota bacterium]
MTESPIFELSAAGRTGYSLPALDVPERPLEELIPAEYLRSDPPGLPELSEPDVVRHFTHLSRLNYSIDSGFYPLGSCTMKYNPKVNEVAVNQAGWRDIHPYQPEATVQGALRLMYELQELLAAITGMTAFTLQPAAGAHGELTGLLMIQAHHRARGETQRDEIIAPDSSHGTNPASAATLGYKLITVPSDSRGRVDISRLRELVGERTAALMLTNPSTLGLFDEQVRDMSRLVHDAGGLMYYDGANLNAIMGVARPGDMGFDVVHLNLHKTFTTPHGGGGPGAGPVGVKDVLAPFLPVPLVAMRDEQFYLEYDRPESIGKVRSFYGNFGMLVRAYTYIRQMGSDGLAQVSRDAVLSANYIRARLRDVYQEAFPGPNMHETVLSGRRQKQLGVRTMDIAKRLMDYGFHPPTVYFPLIVDEALMIEPTETENKGTLDAFVDAMRAIAREAEESPDLVKSAPHTTAVGRLDETRAARNPDLRWRQPERLEPEAPAPANDPLGV